MRYPMLRSLGGLCSMALSALLLAAVTLSLAGCGGSFGFKGPSLAASVEPAAAFAVSRDPSLSGSRSRLFDNCEPTAPLPAL